MSISIVTNSPVYVLLCGLSINIIHEQLLLIDPRFPKPRILYNRNHDDTNKTLIIFPPDVKPEKSIKILHQYYPLNPYVLRPNNFPNSEKTNDLFLVIPNAFSNKEKEVITDIRSKMEELVELKIIPKNCYTLQALMASRERGILGAGCFIQFKSPKENIALARILLEGVPWNKELSPGKDYNFKCYWARKKDPKAKVRRVLEPIPPSNRYN